MPLGLLVGLALHAWLWVAGAVPYAVRGMLAWYQSTSAGSSVVVPPIPCIHENVGPCLAEGLLEGLHQDEGIPGLDSDQEGGGPVRRLTQSHVPKASISLPSIIE